MNFVTRFNRVPVRGVEHTSTSRTQAQFARDCDINVMVRRYLAGDASALGVRRSFPSEVDVTHAPESLHDALNRVTRADLVWSEMPHAIKATYGSYDKFLAAFDAASARVVPEPSNPVTAADKPTAGDSVKSSPSAPVSNT